MKTLAKIDKKYIWITLASLLGITILCVAIFLVTRPSKSSAVRQTQPLATQSIQRLAQSTQQPTPTTIVAQVTTAPFVAGSFWAVYQIVYQAYENEGYRYDVATFTNLETGETLTGHCAEPSWPSPPLGSTYKINQAGIFIPVAEDMHHPYQRFILLEP
jgi:hypothetical protein